MSQKWWEGKTCYHLIAVDGTIPFQTGSRLDHDVFIAGRVQYKYGVSKGKKSPSSNMQRTTIIFVNDAFCWLFIMGYRIQSHA